MLTAMEVYILNVSLAIIRVCDSVCLSARPHDKPKQLKEKSRVVWRLWCAIKFLGLWLGLGLVLVLFIKDCRPTVQVYRLRLPHCALFSLRGASLMHHWCELGQKIIVIIWSWPQNQFTFRRGRRGALSLPAVVHCSAALQRNIAAWEFRWSRRSGPLALPDFLFVFDIFSF